MRRSEKKHFAAIIRFVQHREASGPAKEMMEQIRSDKKLRNMLVDYETKSEIIGMMEFVHDLKNEAAPSHVPSNRTAIWSLLLEARQEARNDRR